MCVSGICATGLDVTSTNTCSCLCHVINVNNKIRRENNSRLL